MPKINLLEYKRAKKKEKELDALLKDIDKAADILYNNLKYSSIWETIKVLEEARVRYYVEYYEYKQYLQRTKK